MSQAKAKASPRSTRAARQIISSLLGWTIQGEDPVFARKVQLQSGKQNMNQLGFPSDVACAESMSYSNSTLSFTVEVEGKDVVHQVNCHQLLITPHSNSLLVQHLANDGDMRDRAKTASEVKQAQQKLADICESNLPRHAVWLQGWLLCKHAGRDVVIFVGVIKAVLQKYLEQHPVHDDDDDDPESGDDTAKQRAAELELDPMPGLKGDDDVVEVEQHHHHHQQQHQHLARAASKVKDVQRAPSTPPPRRQPVLSIRCSRLLLWCVENSL
jgi:hypothetical protein